MTKKELSKEQRTMFILLHEILQKLEPESDYHSKAIKILENGYYEMFGEEYYGVRLSDPLSYEQMEYVEDILIMYDWLQKSYESLGNDDKKKVNKEKIIFGGFDGNNEIRLLMYARFVIEDMKRWDWVKKIGGLNTHSQTGRLYEAMLKATPKHEGQMLSVEEINKIINPFKD